MKNGGPCKHGVRLPNPCEECGAERRLSAPTCSRCVELEAQRDQAYEALHFANGTAELAVKHRDAAEAVIEQIRQLVTTEHESKRRFIDRVKRCLPPDPFPEND